MTAEPSTSPGAPTSGRDRWRRWVVLAAVLTLPTAIGAAAAVGPGRLAHHDPWVGAAGTVVLLVLLAVWGVALGRLTRTRRRLWWLVPAVVWLVVSAEPAGVATWAVHPAPTPPGSGAPRGASVVHVAGADGTTLTGWYLPGSTGATVILVAGASSTHSSVTDHAAVLSRHGFGVLLLDARGHGDSDGHPMELGWRGSDDIVAAVTALTDLPGTDPDRIGVLGLSMGGEEAIGASGLDPRIRVVVAEGATARTAQDKSAWLPRHPLGQLQRGMDRWRDVLVLAMSGTHPPPSLRSAVAASSAPTLLVTAGEVADEGAAAAAIAAADPRDVTVWEVPGATHISGLRTDPGGWERTVTGFLDAALLGDERPAPEPSP